MRQKILEIMISRGVLLHPSTAEHILSQKDPLGYTEDLFSRMKDVPSILTMEAVTEFENTRSAGTGSSSVTFEQKTQNPATNTVSEIAIPIERLTPRLPFQADAGAKPVAGVSELVHMPGLTIAPAVPVANPVPEGISAGAATGGVRTKKPQAAEYGAEVAILKDITGNSTAEGSVRGFNDYFKDRFQCISAMLRNKREMANALELRSARHASGEVKFIGMVSEVRTTKNGNKMVMLEDENTSLRVIIGKENRFFLDPVVPDEVIGVVGSVGKNDMVLADSITRPDIPGMRVPNKAKADVSAAFISDIHIGSKTFLPEQWEKFTKWLKSCEDGAEKVKYLVISGDMVDGVGVFPGQENELLIQDIHEQYQEFAGKLAEIPDHIRVIILPGNHDAVRPSEPQPALAEEIRNLLSATDCQFVGNPCLMSLHGVQVLAYHGRSFDDFISHFPGATYSSPIPSMKEMLKRRHLAPIYGGKTPIAPEKKDYLVIDRVPDIFVTGHVHSVGVEVYRGVVLINSSTWQSQTAYQVMHNFNPVPAKVPIVNLQTGEWEVKDFLS
jgi:DNA polymerase II small subunit